MLKNLVSRSCEQRLLGEVLRGRLSRTHREPPPLDPLLAGAERSAAALWPKVPSGPVAELREAVAAIREGPARLPGNLRSVTRAACALLPSSN